MDIAFDIETIPNSAMIEQLPEVEIKTGNLKDPAKIAEKIAEAKKEQIEKMALSPLYGRVCAFVAIDDSGTLWKSCIQNESDEDEVNVIETLFRTIAGKRAVSYNGNGFDLPFLYRRAVILGINPGEFGLPVLSAMTERKSKFHIDIMNAWCGFGQFEKLDNLARAILNDQKNDIDFKDFPELIKSEEGRDTILAYCAQDVALTMKLWNRIDGILV